MPSLTPHAFDAFVVHAGFLGDAAVFALGDGTLRLVRDGSTAVVVAHDGAVLAAARTLDGKAVLTGGDDGRLVRIAPDGTAETLATRKGKLLDVIAAGPDGAVGYAAGRVAVVRTRDGREKEFAHERAVTGVAFAPKGFRIATSTYDMARVFFVDAATKPTDLAWKGSHIAVTWSPDARYVVTSMQETALHGWRLEDAKHMRMTGYPTKVKSWSWSKGGKWLASSGAAAAIVWPFAGKDGPMGKAPAQLGPYSKLVTRVAFHPSEDVVAAGYEDGLVMAIRMSDEAEVVLVKPSGSPVTALAWDDAGFRVGFGTEAGAAGVVDLRG